MPGHRLVHQCLVEALSNREIRGTSGFDDRLMRRQSTGAMLRTSVRWRPRVAAVVSSVALVLFVVVGGAPPASAHTELVSATPAAGTRVTVAAPLTVSLTFNEALDPALASMVLVDSSEKVVSSGPVSVDGATVMMVTRDVPDPGKYVVRYRVVGGDGHPVDGESTFRVAAPASSSGAADVARSPGASPEADSAADPVGSGSAADAPEPASAGDRADDGGYSIVVGVTVVAAAGALGVLAVLARRRGPGHGSSGA
jgi:methionine-rich copper-binding protein CopC